MNNEQRQALNDNVMYMRAGRIKRRTFLERVLSLGLTMSSAIALLESCGTVGVQPGCTPNNHRSKPNTLVWQSEHDDSAIFSDLVARFQANHKDIAVVYFNSSYADNQQYANISNNLSSCSDAIDIASIDVIWLAEYAQKRWILLLPDTVQRVVNDKYVAGSKVVASCTYNSKLYSAPLLVDQGVLYYRHDICSHPPKTYQDLKQIAQDAVHNHTSGVIEGYVWQANQYEGLVCNFIEILAGYGGTILSADNHTVTVAQPAGVDALTEMMSWIGTISPKEIIGSKSNKRHTFISGYEESDTRVRWQNGYAAFMRNWYNAFYIVSDPTQSVVGDLARFSCMPARTAHSGQTLTGYSCFGGWQLAVNRASQHTDLAWQFIVEALTNPNTASLYPGAQPVSPSSSDISIAAIEQHVVSRPVLANYPSQGGISEHIQAALYQALIQANSGKNNRDLAASILKRLATDLKPLLHSS